MPQSPRSLRLTDAYRQRVLATRERLQTQAQRTWPTIETLDGTDWVDRMAATLTQAQAEAVRVSAAYLTAFLASETGKRNTVSIDSRNYAGKSRDGRPLSESLRSPLIGTLKGLKDGLGASESLSVGLNRAVRMVGVDYDNAHHTALLETIDSDERFDGWQRALAGTCGACASAASGISHDPNFPVHPGCRCVAEPVVKSPYSRPLTKDVAEALAARRPAMEVVGKASDEIDDAVRLAAREIQEQLDLDELPLSLNYKKFRVAGQDGEFSRSTRSISVDVNAAPEIVPTTYAHEFGHYLDKIFGARLGVIADNAARQELLATIKESGSLLRLKELKASFKDLIPSASARKGANKFLNYLMSDDELVARAFEQYMSLRRPALRSSFELNRTTKTITDIDVTIRDNKYWSDEEFAPVAEKIDRWLESLGVRV